VPSIEFKGKSFIENHHFSIPHHTLELSAKDSVLPKGEQPSLSGNLIIEGDNLIGLKSLLPTHAGKIKCAYMDPPYNTGNEGWIYHDNYSNHPLFLDWLEQEVGKEGEDYRRHDKWLCMMWPRLKIIKDLLCEDGVIFISIDNNEVHRLRMVMDEIFGVANYIENFVWKKSYGGGAKEKYAVTLHEYVLLYAKSKEKCGELWLRPKEDAEKRYYKFQDEKVDQRGPYRLKPLEATQSMDERKNLAYPIPLPGGGEIWPKRQWWWAKQRALEALKNNELVFTTSEKGTTVSYKQYLRDELGAVQKSKPFSIIDGVYTQHGTANLTDLFGDVPFAFSKPAQLIASFVEMSTSQDDIILDCTAGSGTTGQAILQLNQEDSGNRRFVLIQQKHDTRDDKKKKTNVCRDITRERVKRVIEGKNAPATGGSFSYARLSEKPMLGDYRLMDEPPPFRTLAEYIFHTETSETLNGRPINEENGWIGEHAGQSYYLLYRPDVESDRALDAVFLNEVALKDKNFDLVVYCEKLHLDRRDLRDWEQKTGKKIRTAFVPFELK
jgi:adenine-specific DNA-methyltransferase